jgi:hypothetical protein
MDPFFDVSFEEANLLQIRKEEAFRDAKTKKKCSSIGIDPDYMERSPANVVLSNSQGAATDCKIHFFKRTRKNKKLSVYRQ